MKNDRDQRSLPARLVAALREYQARRTRHGVARSLDAMDDHFLNDIGITRSEIWTGVPPSRS